MSITLYHHPLSGHAHRVELLLCLLDLPFSKIKVDLAAGKQRSPEFLAKNPLGQVPVIEDGGITIADSNAILAYLARRYDEAGSWLPRDPVGTASVQRWLSLAAGELNAGPAALRAHSLLALPIERALAERTTTRLFEHMESVLGGQPFLVGDGPTIADLALYAYTARAPEGGFSLEPYPSIRAWLGRVEALPRFVPMLEAEKILAAQ